MKKIIAILFLAMVLSFSMLNTPNVNAYPGGLFHGQQGALFDVYNSNGTFYANYNGSSQITQNQYVEYTLPSPVNLKGHVTNIGYGEMTVRLYNSSNTLVHSYNVSYPQNQGAIVNYATAIQDVKRIRFTMISSYGWLNDFDFFEAPAPPTIPTGLTGTPGTNKVDLTWNPSTDASGIKGYNVYRNATKINSGLLTATNYTDLTVTPEVIYSYQVTAVDNENMESAKSSSVVIEAWSAPVNPVLTYSNLKDVSLRLSWDDVANSFEVYKDNVLITNPSTYIPYYDVTGLTALTSYEFKVIGIDRFGRRMDSNLLTIQTLEPPPDKPDVSFTDVKHNGFKVTWNSVLNANTYDLYLDNTKIINTTSLEHTFNSLLPETIYVVKVVAIGNQGNNERELSVKTLKAPIPEILNASISNGSSMNKRNLTYTASPDVTGVDVYVNGDLIGTYPVTQNSIELDFASIADLFTEIKITPTDLNGKSYSFSALTKTTGSTFVDDMLAGFLDGMRVIKKAFLYFAFVAIPLSIIVVAFFWYRGKFKKIIPDRGGENKPFAYVSNKENSSKLKKLRKSFGTDDTPDERERYGKAERMKYASQKHFERTGFHIKEEKHVRVPVGLLGMGGVKIKKDHTYERNGVEYKLRYVKGQGQVYKPKDFSNQVKLVSNQYKAVKSAFTGSNKKFK